MKIKSKAKLSTNLLQMKFMKRTAAENQKEAALEEQNKLVDDEHWYLDVKSSSQIKSNDRRSFIIEPSYSPFNQIGFGRQSFNGFNPLVEKLMMAGKDGAGGDQDESKEEVDVDDDLMAKKLGKRSSNNNNNGTNNKKYCKRLK